MKKLILLILLFLPFVLPEVSWAQRFNGGVVAGICASQVDGDTYAGFDKLGFQGGVFVNTKFSDAWGAQMEIKYNGKGARKRTSKDDFETYSLTLHYIDLPLMVNFTIKEKYILDAGLVPGYLFAKNGEENGYKFTDEEISAFKKFDLSWLLGFNYKITDNFIANIRYSYSLFSIRDYENIDANYGIIAQIFGYTNGDYNNFLTMGIYYQFD
jgi:opacity protein-like surface antigen